jgi:putative ABC transport system ATP-binding protein
MSDSVPAIEINNITVAFDGKTVIQDFSLSVSHGDKIIITGGSGSGKSTILHCILGFVFPREGTIYIDGQQLTHESVWQLRHKLAYVAQEPDLGEGTLREALKRPFSYKANHHLTSNLSRTEELFEQFHLPNDLLQKNVSRLSGGEKQRGAIVSAILLGRKIFLLDEVCSALDKTTRRSVIDFFGSEMEFTFVWISHHTVEASFSSRTVELPVLSRDGVLR